MVIEDFLTDFIPEIFLRVEFGRIGWKIQERDVGGDDKVAAAVVGRRLGDREASFYVSAFAVAAFWSRP